MCVRCPRCPPPAGLQLHRAVGQPSCERSIPAEHGAVNGWGESWGGGAAGSALGGGDGKEPVGQPAARSHPCTCMHAVLSCRAAVGHSMQGRSARAAAKGFSTAVSPGITVGTRTAHAHTAVPSARSFPSPQRLHRALSRAGTQCSTQYREIWERRPFLGQHCVLFLIYIPGVVPQVGDCSI